MQARGREEPPHTKETSSVPANSGESPSSRSSETVDPDPPTTSHGKQDDHSHDDALEALLRQKEEIEQKISAIVPTLTVMFMDLCSSSKIFYDRGDFEAYKVVQRFRNTCLSNIYPHNPEFVDLSGGDQILVGFAESHVCIGAAVAALSALVENNRELRKQDHNTIVVDASVGIHCGHVMYSEGNLKQCTVLNFGKRLQDSADRNQIFISQAVFDSLGGRSKHRIIAHGPRSFKNIPKPQPVYEIDWGADVASAHRSGVLFNTPKGPTSVHHGSNIPRSYQETALTGTQGTVPHLETGGDSVSTEGHPPPVSHSVQDQTHQPSSANEVSVATREDLGDVTSIGEAIACAPDGVEIVIQPGNYEENVVVDRDDITLKTLPDTEVRIVPDNGVPLRITKAKNVRIKGLALAGKSTNAEQIAGLQVDHARQVTIEDCAIQRSRGSGCFIYGSGTVTFKNTKVENCRRGGMYVSHLSHVELDDCTITDNGGFKGQGSNVTGFGLLVNLGSRAGIKRTVVGGNEGPGVAVVGKSSRFEATRCLIQGNGVTRIKPGVYAENAEGSVKQCEIIDNGGPGVHAKGGVLSVRRNKISYNGALCKPPQPGILFTNSPRSDARWNSFHGNGVDDAKWVKPKKPPNEPQESQEEISNAASEHNEEILGSLMWYKYLKVGERIKRPKDRPKEDNRTANTKE